MNEYQKRIRLRIKLQWALLGLMAVFMVVVGETGGGDSRKISQTASTVSRILFFGGGIYVAARIAHNRKLLQNKSLLRAQRRKEQDERERFLHDKSGGTVMDVLLLLLLFVTVATAQYDMSAFATAFGILLAAVALKAGAYCVLSRRY